MSVSASSPERPTLFRSRKYRPYALMMVPRFFASGRMRQRALRDGSMCLDVRVPSFGHTGRR